MLLPLCDFVSFVVFFILMILPTYGNPCFIDGQCGAQNENKPCNIAYPFEKEIRAESPFSDEQKFCWKKEYRRQSTKE
ncbi:hypothetical protein AGMMS4952_20800 [Spirochaetia bacterium]|nr:hypothetical protein AGMMS4952_20800 [Spirochaetia bacterium]